MTTNNFTPEFLYIPYLVMDLQPADRFVFGAIYYFEKMKDGKCFASNEEIARIAKINSRSVANSLYTLEKAGFIKRIFSDKNHRNRKEIRCLIRLKKDTPVDDTSTNDTSTNDKDTPTDDKDTPVGEQISNKINKSINKIIAAEPQVNINRFLSLFEPINPSYERLFSNKTQRGAMERLIKKWGEEKMEATIKALPGIIIKPYAPKITTPFDLERDFGKLITFYKQSKVADNTKKSRIIK